VPWFHPFAALVKLSAAEVESVSGFIILDFGFQIETISEVAYNSAESISGLYQPAIESDHALCA
jgi:hypothetical protein